MTSVKKLLESKSNDIWYVGPEDTVYDAIKMMDDKGVGALVVMLDYRLIGIISERDYARKVILKNRVSKTTQVKDIMTRHVFHIHPDQDISQCMQVMSKYNIRHLPVLEDEKMIGMVSVGDVVKEIISEQKDKIDHLEHYISWEESF